MPERETSREVDDAAAEWAGRVDRAPLSPDDEAALETWLRGDARRLGALARAQALFDATDAARALGKDFEPDAFRPQAPASASRRQLIGWGGGALAASVAASIAGLTFSGYASRAYASQRGEIRLIPLDDGSAITLNTETRVRVRGRRAQLLDGEALFEVADSQQPFVVSAPSLSISATRAAFVVRAIAGEPLSVLVREGVVNIDARGEAVRVRPNEAFALTAQRPLVKPLEPASLSRQLAWREGKIAFEGETMQAAARAFARYSDMRLVIDDPDLAREPISGLFAANDPVSFARSASQAFGAHMTVEGRTVRLSHAIAPARS